MSNNVIDKTIDSIFSLKKEMIYLLSILLLAFILRLIAAINLTVTADDMHFVTHAINFLSSGRMITYDQSSGLWFAITSVFYSIFGIDQLSSRLAAVIFGSATVLSIYLLTREFFNERISLIAAFLIATAPFHIKNTMAEMDVMTLFFVTAAMFFFVRSVKTDKPLFYAISGIFFGISIYTKVYPILFIPSMLIYFAYCRKKENKDIFTKKNFQKIFIFLLCIFVFTIPALTHNYLLYKDKGFMDLQFTRTFDPDNAKSAQYYSFDPIHGEKNDWKGFFFGHSEKHGGGDNSPLFFLVIKFIFQGSPLLLILGALGLLLTLFTAKNRNRYALFFLLSIILIYPFLGSIILLPKHFLFLEVLLVPLASFFVFRVNESISAKAKKDTLRIILVLILIFVLVYLGMPKGTVPHFYSKSYVAQMIEFKEESIPESSLIIGDSRIYRGQMYWMLHGRPFLEAMEFLQAVNSPDLPGRTVNMEIYYVECVYDDCGWGTVKNSPELNESMEALTSFFKEKGTLVTTINEHTGRQSYYPIISGREKVEAIKVYKATITTKDSLLVFAKQPKNWFLYNVGYPDPTREFDYYSPYNAFDFLLNKIAHLIVYMTVLLALISPFYLIYFLIREN